MDAIRLRQPPPPTPAPAAAPVVRVLVVDDLPEICSIFKEVHRRLRAVRIELVTETNSQRALELIDSGAFDLVVSDFRMRQVDGIEVLLRANAKNPAGHRILMTGYNEIPTSLARIKDASVDAYVQKPLRAQDLLLMLLGFLQRDENLIQEHRAHAREIEAQAEETTVALA